MFRGVDLWFREELDPDGRSTDGSGLLLPESLSGGGNGDQETLRRLVGTTSFDVTGVRFTEDPEA